MSAPIDPPAAIPTDDIIEVEVGLEGQRSILGGGTGQIDSLPDGVIVELRCGIFTGGYFFPEVNREYLISGKYKRFSGVFRYNLRCTVAAPVSHFVYRPQ